MLTFERCHIVCACLLACVCLCLTQFTLPTVCVTLYMVGMYFGKDNLKLLGKKNSNLKNPV